MNVISAYKHLLIVLFACGMSMQAQAQRSVTVRSSDDSIRIGDQVTVWLQAVSAVPDDKISWPALPDSLAGIVWVQKGKVDTLKQNDSVILKQPLVVTSFDSGRYVIPSFSFAMQAPGQPVAQLKTDSLILNVQTIPVDTAKPFKPIKDIVPVQSSWTDYLMWIIGGLVAVGLIIFVIWYFLKNRREKTEGVTRVAPDNAHEKALRLLKALEEQHLWQNGQVKQYYDQLSLIVRNYLENRFTIPAMECTTDELLRQTHRMPDLKPFRKPLRSILTTADLVKFAKSEPLPEVHSQCLQAAYDIVEKTKMMPREGNKQ